VHHYSSVKIDDLEKILMSTCPNVVEILFVTVLPLDGAFSLNILNSMAVSWSMQKGITGIFENEF
jgi:hypothetical protein